MTKSLLQLAGRGRKLVRRSVRSLAVRERTVVTSLALATGLAVTVVDAAAQTEEERANAIYRIVVDFVFFNELAAAVAEEPYEAPQQLVVGDSTTLGLGLEEMEDQLPLLLRLQFPAAHEELIRAFLAANERPSLTQLGEMRVPVRTVGRDEMDDLFGGRSDGWERFRERYPGSRGITRFSRVAFDSAYSQAMVYVGNQRDYLAGAGYVFLLERAATGWRILAHQVMWVS